MDKDILSEAKEAFKLADEAEQENREHWLDDMKFARLGHQWPDKIKSQRELEGRPCLTINKLPSFIRQVTNDARQNKPAIKCHPVDDDATEEVAEILNGLIRNIEYSSNADVAYDTALDHAVTSGFGYFRISTDYAREDQFDQDIKIERVGNPLNIYGDPYSTAVDSSDWNTAFVTELLKESEFSRKYPNADLSGFKDGEADAEWFADDKVRIAEYWTREEVLKKLVKLSNGEIMYVEAFEKMKDLLDVMQITVEGERETTGYKVTQRIITGAEVLETNKWTGRYIPIIPVYGDELNIEGKRHFISLIRGSKDAQQMFNFWRTASTELVALAPKAPFIGPKGAFNSDAEKWATANNKSHAYIEYDGQQPPQRQGFAGVPAGALQEALNASDDMKSIMGMYDASLGARSNETSGKAIMARQREGDISTFNYIDNLSRAIKHAGRVIVDLIPHVYNLPRIVRIIHEDGKNESVQINQPHQAEAPGQDGNQNPQQMQGQPGQAPAGMPNAPQGQGMQTPMGENEQQEQQEFLEGVIKLYDVTVGKYDVTCESGPSFTTKREESAQQMMQLMQSMPQAAPLIADLVAKNLDWPGADEIADRLKTMLPPQLQGKNPMQLQQLQQQLQQMSQQLQQTHQQLQEAQSGQQSAAMKAQIDAQLSQQKIQMDSQSKQAAMASDLEIRKAQAAIDAQLIQERAALEMQAKIRVAQMQIESDQEIEEMKGYFELQKAQLMPPSPALTADVEGEFASDEPGEAPLPKILMRKRIQMMAPSGAMYNGTIHDEPMDGMM